MFRFENPQAFYLVTILVAAAMLLWWTHKQKMRLISKFGHEPTVKRLMSGFADKTISYWLTAIGFIFLILAAANPQYGSQKEKARVDTRDIFIALDISRSMDATDISPSRLEKAKKFAEELIKSRASDQIGLIFFAGSAYLQMPLTTDHAAAIVFIRSAGTDMAGTQGTAIGEAIRMAEERAGKDHHKALVVISDGEDHDQDAADAAAEAASHGLTVFTLGIGSTSGARIPVINEGREEFKTDDDGNPVLSALNPDLLRSVAAEGKGEYYEIKGDFSGVLKELNAQLDKMEKRAVDIRSLSEYNSYYQVLLAVGLVLLLAGMYFYNRIKQNHEF